MLKDDALGSASADEIKRQIIIVDMIDIRDFKFIACQFAQFVQPREITLIGNRLFSYD